jgi:hypothetical protein
VDLQQSRPVARSGASLPGRRNRISQQVTVGKNQRNLSRLRERSRSQPRERARREPLPQGPQGEVTPVDRTAAETRDVFISPPRPSPRSPRSTGARRFR